MVRVQVLPVPCICTTALCLVCLPVCLSARYGPTMDWMMNRTELN
jgi:hypothetical protein